MGDLEYPIYELNISGFTEEVRDNGVLRKAWYNNSELGKCLFKETHKPSWLAVDIRSDWSEKVIYEIAKLLELPVARYEFATGSIKESSESVDGILSVNCIPENSTEFSGEDFLMEQINYESSNRSEYVVERVLNALELGKVMPPESWTQMPDIDSGAKLFVGYLMLDALVNNKDRHDHNWGVIAIGNRLELIPSFDHGFSLGASENISKPEFSISYYLDRYRSPFHDRGEPLTPFEVFSNAAKLYPETAQIWQDKLRLITPQQIDEVFERIPEGRITPAAAKFAQDLLAFNQELILSLDLSLSQQLPAISSLNPTQVQIPSPATTSPVTLADLNDWKDDDVRVEQNPETGSLADINNLQSDDTQIAQYPTEGTLADLNLSDESDVESSDEDGDNLGDSDRPSL
jgi:hypothetical protein